MLSKLTLLLMALLILPEQVQAQDVMSAWIGTTVSNEVRLVGQGLQKKRAGDQLAWACKDDACNKVQPIYYDQEKQTSAWVGREIETNGDTEAAIEKYMSCFQSFSSYMNHSNVSFAHTSLPILSGVVTMSVNLPLGIAIIAGGVTPVLLHNFNAFDGTGPIQNATLSQDGWNWSNRPKKMNKSRFAQYLHYISWDFYQHHPEYNYGNSFWTCRN